MPHFKTMSSKIKKIIGDLDDAYFKVEALQNSYIGKDDKKYKFFSNICHELHQINEKLDEFSWNENAKFK